MQYNTPDMETTITTEVIIIGAGPTGLSLACQLIRYGVEFVIFDQKKTITPYSKAIGVQARTLEIYEQVDLANKLIEQGWITEKARFVVGGKVRGEVELSKIGEGMSPYPFLLIVEQGRHEKVLYDFIKANGKNVYDRLRQPKFHLIVFSDAQGDFPPMKTELESQYAKSIDFNLIPLNPRVAEVFGTNSSFNVLLRPDNYIGFISTGTSLSNLRVYLNKLFRQTII